METKSKTNQKQLLLVDDNRLTLLSLEAILKVGGNGWRVVAARDGHTALDEIERQHFDLVVTDYQMPGMNGLELVEAVRGKLPDVPAILMTDHDSRELREDALRLGVSRVLDKPVPGPVFLRAIEEASGYRCQD